VDGVKYETVEIPKPQVPYIALEIMGRDKNVSKGTHIISLAHKQSIKLGRGHDSDVRITDISVSRFHATIKFCNGTYNFIYLL
jgi:pSer/pThr/pTyr-binding forkhead associated (FHA) protein